MPTSFNSLSHFCMKPNIHLFQSRHTLGTFTCLLQFNINASDDPSVHSSRASAPGEAPLTHQSLEHQNTALVINSSVDRELHQLFPPFDIAVFLAVQETSMQFNPVTTIANKWIL